MPLLCTVIRATIRALFRRKQALLLENLALRQQLAAYRRTSLSARLRPSDRIFWVGLSRLWDGWPSALVIAKPETVMRWHRSGFRLFWRRKSRSGWKDASHPAAPCLTPVGGPRMLRAGRKKVWRP